MFYFTYFQRKRYSERKSYFLFMLNIYYIQFKHHLNSLTEIKNHILFLLLLGLSSPLSIAFYLLLICYSFSMFKWASSNKQLIEIETVFLLTQSLSVLFDVSWETVISIVTNVNTLTLGLFKCHYLFKKKNYIGPCFSRQ